MNDPKNTENIAIKPKLLSKHGITVSIKKL